MKDKQIGKTVFKYDCDLAGQHWYKHPSGTRFTEGELDEMNATDVEPPVVLKPFRVTVTVTDRMAKALTGKRVDLSTAAWRKLGGGKPGLLRGGRVAEL